MAPIPPRWLIERKVAGALAARTSAPAARSRATFHRLRVASVERLTEDSVALTFAVPGGLTADYRFAPGQHLTIRSNHGGPGTRRSYSIASPAPDGPLRVGVKLLPGGAFSSWAVADARPGHELEVMTPAGTFGRAALGSDGPGTARHVVALAAGSGITPVLSIVATVLALEPASRVTVLYGSRSTAEIMFAEDLADLKNRHPARLQLLHFLSREPQESPLRAGRLDAAKLDTVLGPAVPVDADAWFLCGPADAVQAWRAALADHGVPPERVHRELFHAVAAGAPRPAAGSDARAALAGPARRVAVTLDGRTNEVAVGAGDSVLDALLRVRPDAPFACRGGVCGTCRATLTRGEVRMAANFALEPEELARGMVLTCQARPDTDDVALDYDR